MEHPTITRINRKGYPYNVRNEQYKVDSLGKEVFDGDEIFEYEDDFFLVDELSPDAIEILEMLGARRKIAKL